MIGWSHRIKYWVFLACQIAAALGFGQIVAAIFLEGEVQMLTVIFVGAVLLVGPLQTWKRGY